MSVNRLRNDGRDGVLHNYGRGDIRGRDIE